MIFSELYSAYYIAVARILTRAVEGTLTEEGMREIVRKSAFGESTLTVLPALRTGKWQLLTKDLRTPLKSPPTMPPTASELRWLKSLTLDPRVRLFPIPASVLDALDGVDPLFTEEDVRVFDRYTDGDPYEDEDYIRRFRYLLRAVETRTPTRIETVGRKGTRATFCGIPERLEYSAKDDKFRLIFSGARFGGVANLARITSCKPCNRELSTSPRPQEIRSVTLLIFDGRNALERVMLHFAHFEKRAERVDEQRYRLTVRYDAADETELVIRILSFGPFVKVESPDSFVELIRARLAKQKRLGLRKP